MVRFLPGEWAEYPTWSEAVGGPGNGVEVQRRRCLSIGPDFDLTAEPVRLGYDCGSGGGTL